MDLEYECKLCKGTGLLNGTGLAKTIKPDIPQFLVYECYGCQGTGKVDWITNVVGFNGEIYLSRRVITKGEYNELESR